jgi:hypothetical protein
MTRIRATWRMGDKMKNLLLATAASALFAPTAMADSSPFLSRNFLAETGGSGYHGAQIDGQFWYNTDAFGSFTTHAVRGTAQYDLNGGRYFFQPEASLYDFDFSATGVSVGGHVGMMPTANLDIGLFATYNTWLPAVSGEVIFGAEAKGTNNAVTWEAYLAMFYNSLGGVYGGAGRADVWYEFDERITVGGGVGILDIGLGWQPQATLRAAYDITDSFNIEANYTYTDNLTPNHGFGVKLTTTFDRGVTFGARDYMSVRMGF